MFNMLVSFYKFPVENNKKFSSPACGFATHKIKFLKNMYLVNLAV